LATVRREGDAEHGGGSLVELVPGLAGRPVPHPDRVVPTAGGNPSAVGRDRHGKDLSSMAFQTVNLAPARDVPNPGRPVKTTRDEPLAVRKKRDAPDWRLMAGHSRNFLSG